jgi:hypothetical protein
MEYEEQQLDLQEPLKPMIPTSRERIRTEIARTLTVANPSIPLPCDSTVAAVIRDMPISNGWKSRMGGEP